MVGEFSFNSTNNDHLQDIQVPLVLQMIGVENQIAFKKAGGMVGEFRFHKKKHRLQNIQVHLLLRMNSVENQMSRLIRKGS